MNGHPGYIELPDWQFNAIFQALALARSMVLSAEPMSPTAQAQIDTAIGYLKPWVTPLTQLQEEQAAAECGGEH